MGSKGFFLILPFKIFALKDLVISIASILFNKHIPFCLYRFPGEKRYCLAIDTAFHPFPKKKTLWIVPFQEQEQAPNLLFDVIDPQNITEAWLRELTLLPQLPPIQVPIPKETSQEEYFKAFNGFLNEIHAQKLEKAVLSRVLYHKKPDKFNPIDCFLSLASAYPDTFVHLSQHPYSGIWMGATPELLLKKEQRQIAIMALAGTQSVNQGGNYHWRHKEREEQAMVADYIEQIFQKNHFVQKEKAGPKTVEAGRVAHLRTDYIYFKEEAFSLKKLLKDVHPTPAVGGLPLNEGLACISKHENYNRKYYCGFIGETDFEQQGVFYVNLRCMQIGDHQIALFAGGGITAASKPEEEWQETILKSKTMAEKIQPSKESQHGIVG